MHEVYSYSSIRIERGAWRRVAAGVHGAYSRRVGEAGGVVFGLWSGEVGTHSDEGFLMTAWADREALSTAGDLGSIDGVAESYVERLVATVRPVSPEPPLDDGLYVHRWFEVSASDWEEFLDLSNTAWPSMEGAFPGVRIIGLWRSLETQPFDARVLLVTRYENLDQWDRSRYYRGDPVTEAKDAYERFARRARLTQRTIARFTRLMKAAPQNLGP